MAVVEILGDKMHKVFKELGINYTKTYSKRCNPKKKYDPHYAELLNHVIYRNTL